MCNVIQKKEWISTSVGEDWRFLIDYFVISVATVTAPVVILVPFLVFLFSASALPSSWSVPQPALISSSLPAKELQSPSSHCQIVSSATVVVFQAAHYTEWVISFSQPRRTLGNSCFLSLRLLATCQMWDPPWTPARQNTHLAILQTGPSTCISLHHLHNPYPESSSLHFTTSLIHWINLLWTEQFTSNQIAGHSVV